MDQQTLNKLEFDQVTAALVATCACSLGQALARKIRPSSDPRQVRHWLDQVRQMMLAESGAGLPPLGAMHDIRAQVEESGTSAALEPEDLGRVQETLAATGLLFNWFDPLPAELDLLRHV